MKSLLSLKIITLPSLILFASSAIAQNTTSIIALVNDEPISNHDVNMRVKLSLANSKDFRARLQNKLKRDSTKKRWRKMLEEYQPRSREEAQKLQKKLVQNLKNEVRSSMAGSIRKKILKELVDERIQLQQASKLGVALSDEDLDERLDRIAARNKSKKTGKPLTRHEFSASLKRMGIPVSEFRNRMKARGSWIRVVKSKFQYQINIGDQQVDQMIDTQTDEKAKLQTIYKIQRVRFAMSPAAAEPAKAKRVLRAQELRRSINSCKKLSKAVGRIKNATLKSLGSKSEDTFPHTMQVFLRSTKEGRLTPPTLTSSGIELYAVCGRKQRRKADQSKRKAVKEKLRQQEFEILARRHLQDLRQEASIEYR